MTDADDPESIGACSLRKSRSDPTTVFTYEKGARSIRIGLTRDILRELSFRPYEGRRRVIVLARRRSHARGPVQRDAQDARGAGAIHPVGADHVARAPPAADIRSRCLKLRFRAP
jgi:hypothetical protein